MLRIGRRSARALGGLLLAAVIGGLGLFLLADRPGLEVEYFAIDPEWRGRPVDSDIGLPGLESRRAAGYRLLSHEVFSIRWRGWVRIEREGRYRFSIESDERAYLKLDDTELAAIENKKNARAAGGRRLAPGLHPLEIGMSQTGGPARLAVRWAAPGGEAGALPADALFARRPGWVRRALRNGLSPLSPVLRRLLGAGLILAALGWMTVIARKGAVPGIPGAAGAWSGLERRLIDPRLRPLFLLALVAAVWWLVYRFTARTVDGDDVRYLDAAMFDRPQPWILNRYSHVYLVRFFIWLTGDGFLAGRHLWSFTCAGTVAALTVAAHALGRRSGARTLLVALFLLFSQVVIWGTIGAAFTDYSTMLFVTAGVAVYLAGRSRETEVAWEWPALVLGALTVLAYRSKETGLILLWLLLLLLWCEGRIDWRRSARRLGCWLAGAAAAYLVLMSLDGLLLGDFWFSLRRESVEGLQINLADLSHIGRSSGGWMEILWQPGVEGRPRDHSLRHLSLLVVVAALAVSISSRRVETCLLHLLPLAYLGLLIVAHIRGNFVHSPRHLLPILPAACLLAAALFSELGIEEPPWRKLLSPPVLLSLGPVVAVVWLILAPYRIGELAAESFVPAGTLERFGWVSADFVDLTLGPLLMLFLIAALALSLRAARARLLVALLCLPFLFGTAFELTRLSLARGGAVQRGDLILYPWDAFGEEIEASGRPRLFISSELFRRYGMAGQRVNRNRIAGVFFRRDGMTVEEIAVPTPDAALIVASRREYERWLEDDPAFDATATYDASGELVLLRR